MGLIDWRISWDLDDENAFLNLSQAAVSRGKPDLVINCDGFNPVTKVIASWLKPKWVVGGCMSYNMRNELYTGTKPNNKILDEQEWDSKEFLEKYNNHLQSQYIAELMCTMTFIEPLSEEVKNISLPSRLPKIEVPEVLIHCTATRSAKQWHINGWLEILEWCFNNKLNIGLVGADPKLQKQNYFSGTLEDELLKRYGSESNNGKQNLLDLRGKTSLIELAGVCKAAQAVIGVDSGPLHIAAAVGVPVMAIVGNDIEGIGASPIRLWMPRSNNVSRTVSKTTCSLCSDNRFKNNACIAENHYCMENVEAAGIVKWLKKITKEKNKHEYN